MKFSKRLFILLPVLAVLVATLTLTVFAETPQATALTLDETVNVQITEEDTSAWLSFTPAKTGIYLLYSDTESDTRAALYDAQMKELSTDDDGGAGANFCLSYELEKDATYYFEVRFYSDDETGAFPVTLIASPIKSITNATANMMEFTSGYWESHNTSVGFVYDYTGYATYTVTFTDGTTQEVEGWEFEYNGMPFYLDQQDSQGDSSYWEGGNTYTGNICAGGVSGQITVSIEKLPVKSLQLEPISIIKESSGYFDEYWDYEKEEYVSHYIYEYDHLLSGTVTFTDGSTATIDSNCFNYKDYGIELFCTDLQGDEFWTVGNTYNATVFLGNLTQTVPVSIIDSPVKSMVAQPITVYADVDGELYDDGVYYYWQNKLVLTITFTDGTTYTTQPGEGYVEYKGNVYKINTEDEQPWSQDKTYTAQVSVLGVTAPVSVTTKGNWIKSVQVPDLKLNAAFHSSDYGYPYYYWHEYIEEITVTFADGSTFTGDRYDFEEQYNCYVNYTDDQSEETPWLEGKNYTGYLLFGAQKVPVKVTIEASPVKSVSVEPIIMPEDTGEYYNWAEHLLYTVTLKDGTKLVGDPNGLYYDGRWYWADHYDDQEETPWTTGSHTGTIMVMGKECSVPVYIGKVYTSGNYSYVRYNSKAYLCNCDTGKTTLSLPSSVGGYSVVGVLSVGDDLEQVENLTIPSSVTYLDPAALWGDGGNMQKLTIGSGVKLFTAYHMYGCDVEEVSVNSSNANYSSTDGVVYDKNKTRLVFYPWSKSDSHTIPNTVTDIQALINDHMTIYDLNVTLGTGTKDQYVQENGIVYTKDKSVLVFCNATTSGSFTLPGTVKYLADGAFAHSGFSSITIHDGITNLPYYAFFHSKSLTKVNLPNTLDALHPYTFYNCAALKSVTIPDGVTTIDLYAFANSSVTTLVIPASLEYVDRHAFYHTDLTDVYYQGDEAAWQNIEIVPNGNEALFNARIHYPGEEIIGDLDGDFQKTTNDAVYLLLAVMFGEADYPVPAGTDLDFDNSGSVDTNDAVYLLLNVMFGEDDYPI